ncbi:MAG: hypothetical protein WCV79_01975 [Candidatus Paceibacterota bacterium]
MKNLKLQNTLLFLLPLLVVAFVFRAVIFSNAIFAHLDVLINYLPYFNALFSKPDVIEQGIISGFPILVSVSTTWFSPISYIASYFFDALGAFVFLNMSFIAGAYVFTYLFGRRIGLSHLSAILAGIIYIFAGQVMLWSETIIITIYYCLLPLAFYLLHIAYEGGRMKKYSLFFVTGILLGIGWLSGHVQFLIYVHIFVAAYWLFKTWVSFKYPDNSRSMMSFWIEEVVLFAFMFGISYLVGHPLISAIQDFLPLTQRLEGVSLASAFAYAYMPYHAIHYLLPQFSVPYSPIPYSQAFQNYIGILPLFLALYGLINWKRIANLRSESGFFLIMGLFALIASLKYSPVTYIFHYLPLVKTFREAPRIMFAGDFCIALYLGFVLDYILVNKASVVNGLEKMLKWLKRTFLIIALPIITAFSIAHIFFHGKIQDVAEKYFMANMYSKTSAGLPVEHYTKLIDSYVNTYLSQVSIASLGVLTFVAMSVITFWWLKNLQKMSQRNLGVYAVVIVALNFALAHAGYVHAIPRNEYLTPPKSYEIIMANENKNKSEENISENVSINLAEKQQPFRIFSPLNGLAMFNESVRCSYPTAGNWEVSHDDFLLRKELMETNMNMIYGIESADGYEPYLPVRVSDIIGYAGSRFAVTDSYGMDIGSAPLSLEDKVRLFAERKNILRSMNVKYVLSFFAINDPDLQEIGFEKVGSCDSPVYIYELNNVWPRYFLTRNVRNLSGKNNEEIFKSYVSAIASSTGPTILIENMEKNVKAGNKSFARVAGIVGSKTMKFAATTTEDAYLFVGNTWLPDWSATIDGKPREILKANYTYMALYIPMGSHDIVFTYDGSDNKQNGK